MKTSLAIAASATLLALTLAACGKDKDKLEAAADLDELGNATAASMQAIDEVSGGGGSINALLTPRHRRVLEARPWYDHVLDAAVPPAYAAACSTIAFGSCSSGVKSRNFGASAASGCTTGYTGVTTHGTATLTFFSTSSAADNTVCTNGIGPSGAGAGVTRTINRTATGRRGATLVITSDAKVAYDGTSIGGGQKLTYDGAAGGTASSTVSVLGMNRIATLANGTELFNISTRSTADLTVTGATRATRKVTAGTWQIFHNLAKYTMTVSVKDAVGWSSDCDTPTTGSLSGTLSGARTGNVTVKFTGCGTLTVTQSDDDESTSSDSTLDTVGSNG